jgi:hypothetical protein
VEGKDAWKVFFHHRVSQGLPLGKNNWQGISLQNILVTPSKFKVISTFGMPEEQSNPSRPRKSPVDCHLASVVNSCAMKRCIIRCHVVEDLWFYRAVFGPAFIFVIGISAPLRGLIM